MSDAYATAKQPLHGITAGDLSDVGNIVQFVSPDTDILVEANYDADASTQTGINTPSAASGTFDINKSFIPPQLPLPYSRRSFSDSFKAIQKWEGYVIEVYEDTFLARLIPIVGEGTDQNAEIYIEEVEPADRVLIEPGAVFYWSIGYLDKPSGRHRDSYIRFRRLPAWSQRELDAAKRKANRLKELLNVE
ncbi:MAG: hypothetical protein GXP42_09420 [Chloroflexi bacterium]|nr:hypothetical protein [Chloroflexota bacterium]